MSGDRSLPSIHAQRGSPFTSTNARGSGTSAVPSDLFVGDRDVINGGLLIGLKARRFSGTKCHLTFGLCWAGLGWVENRWRPVYDWRTTRHRGHKTRHYNSLWHRPSPNSQPKLFQPPIVRDLYDEILPTSNPAGNGHRGAGRRGPTRPFLWRV